MEILRFMAQSKHFVTTPALPATSFHDQQQRQRLSPDWTPKGLERYQNTYNLVKSMPVLGFSGEPGYAADRFTPPKENYG